MSLLVVAFMISCNEDDPIIEEEEGLPVSDGFYFAKVGEDPTAVAQLKPANVDGPGISSLERNDFFQTYAYLTAGSYNLVEVTSKAVANTYGGSLTAVTEVHNDECDVSGYNLVEATVDGAGFSVAADGLYVLAYDVAEGEIVYDTTDGAIEVNVRWGDARDGTKLEIVTRAAL